MHAYCGDAKILAGLHVHHHWGHLEIRFDYIMPFSLALPSTDQDAKGRNVIVCVSHLWQGIEGEGQSMKWALSHIYVESKSIKNED